MSSESIVQESITNLMDSIVKLPYILEVRAIFPKRRSSDSKYLDGKWVDFQILHNYQTEWDYFPPQKVQDQIFDLIFNANWELRNKTGEKYYFDHQYYFGDFPGLSLSKMNQVIASSTHSVEQCYQDSLKERKEVYKRLADS